MTQKRLLFFILVLLFIGMATYFLIKTAKGYRFSLWQRGFEPSGLLVATSVPDGAQIWVEGKLKSATNTTLFLSPGDYQVEIKKDGYTSWEKSLAIEKELVTKTDAWLFPLVPNLQGLTFTGANRPLLSPDGTKIVYQVKGSPTEKNGLWVLDLADLPFGIGREPRQITRSTLQWDFSKITYSWSPDSRQILVTRKPSALTEENFLLEANSFITSTQLAETAKNFPLISLLKNQWEKEEELKQKERLLRLPNQLADFFQNNTKNLFFSPDETKILFTATASATLPEGLIPPLPGRSTQPQERTIKPNQTYVYDLREDRNFLISQEKGCLLGPRLELSKLEEKNFPNCTLRWFPTSRHLILVEKEKIQIGEYEGTNWLTVYSGPYQFPFAHPHPSAQKLIILTNLSTLPDSSPNLYAVSLR